MAIRERVVRPRRVRSVRDGVRGANHLVERAVLTTSMSASAFLIERWLVRAATRDTTGERDVSAPRPV